MLLWGHCLVLFSLNIILVSQLPHLVRWENIGEDIAESLDCLEHHIDIFWVFTEGEQVTQLAISVGWVADDFISNSLDDADFLREGHFSHELWCHLLPIRDLLLLLDSHLFKFLIGGTKSCILSNSFLRSLLSQSILPHFFDLAPIIFLLLTTLLARLFAK